MRTMAMLLVVMAMAIAMAHGMNSCMDQNGSPVDWFVVMKIPKLLDSPNPKIQDGFGYFYMDSHSPQLELSPYYLDSQSEGAIFHTVSVLYTPTVNSSAYLLYNDQSPDDKDHDTYAHSKGVLFSGMGGGFWLVHSVPNFVNFTDFGYNYPDSGDDNGQSFLCMSLSASTVDAVASIFLLNKPYVYQGNLPSAMSSSFPNMADVLAHNWQRVSKSSSQAISTVGGVSFMQFGKSSLYEKFLYEDIVSPYYSANLVVESWQNGANSNKVPSFCTPSYTYNVMNADTVGFSPIEWPHTKDHSKWAVGDRVSVACIGDMNRQFSQNRRGGGTVCRLDNTYWTNFNRMVVNVTACGQTESF